MAGNRIRGITVEIGGDTTKLQTALKGVNTEIRNTQSQLKDVEKLLKLDPGNTKRSRRSTDCWHRRFLKQGKSWRLEDCTAAGG